MSLFAGRTGQAHGIRTKSRVRWRSGSFLVPATTASIGFKDRPISLSKDATSAGANWPRITFTIAGTYSYHCNIHSFMTGQVIVG